MTFPEKYDIIYLSTNLGNIQLNKLNEDKFYMSFQEIANQLNMESDYQVIYTANSVKKIFDKAMIKLKKHKNLEILRDFY